MSIVGIEAELPPQSIDGVMSALLDLSPTGSWAEQNLLEAKAFFEARLYQETVRACDICLEAEPDHPEALRLHAKANLALRNFEAAVLCFARYRALRPADPNSHFDLARAQMLAGNFVEAAEGYQDTLSLRPGRLDARTGRARALIKAGDFPNGGAALRELAQEYPAASALQMELLSFLVLTKDFDEAIVLGSKILAEWPELALAHRHLGKALRGIGSLTEAVVHFARFVEARPEDPAGHHDLGRALAGCGEQDAALVSFMHVRDIAPGRRDIDLDIGRSFAAKGDWAAAEKHFLVEIAERPDSAAAYREICRMLVARGQHRRALRILREALTHCPRESRLHSQIAQIHRQLGHFRAAARQFRTAIGVVGDDTNLLFDSGRFHLAEKRFTAALSAFEKVLALDPERADLPRQIASSLVGLRRPAEAEAVLREAVEKRANDVPVLQELGRLLNTQKRFEDAAVIFQDALRHDPRSVTALHGLGVALRRSGMIAEARGSFEQAVRVNTRHTGALLQLAELAHLGGELENGIGFCNRILAVEPKRVNARLLRAQMFFERGEAAKAMADLDQIMTVDPEHTKAVLFRELVRREMIDAGEGAALSLCLIETSEALRQDAQALASEISVVEVAETSWRQQIAASTADWIVVAPGPVPSLEQVAALRGRTGPMVGAVVGTVERPWEGTSLWARETLQSWIAMEEESQDDWRLCAAGLAERLRVRSLQEAPAPVRSGDVVPQQRGKVWLVSSSGMNLFGGVERFLRNMVPIYRDMGFEPVIVGLLESLDGVAAEGEAEGVSFINLPRTVEAVRAAGLLHRPTIVQCTTGIGYEVAHGLEGQKARIIYGTHFWRDMFVGTDSFANVDIDGRPRAEFKRLCTLVDQAYANSDYTRDVIANHFGVTQPIIYSLPFDEPVPTAPPKGDYVLLMNGRPDKGFSLVLELAERLPHIPFRVVASQVSRERIEELVRQHNLENVEIQEWVSDVAALYRGARAVMVASYAFVETFSRVTIEAHRYGVPVIGSDRGNVPILLRESGVSLPEDAGLWAEEIGRLFADETYYRRRCAAAAENSIRYRFSDQPARVQRVAEATGERIAVAIGSGIGNMIQCSPVIRRIAEHFGRPIDVIIKQDFAGCSRLFAGSPYVGQVVEEIGLATRMHYRAVLVLDSFGDMIPRFNSDATYVTRRRFPFNMTKDMHEAEFNLLCAREFMGVPYRPEDAARYFLGSITPTMSRTRRIGLHAGGKAGIWMAKRWPYFQELVARLQARGYEVASFGGPAEYIEGTTDLTGTDLETSLRNIAECGYFIANDSGLMHVADALGIPLTAIFGPTSVVKNGPLSPASLTIAVEKDCAPCQFDPERFQGCRCIRELSLDDVDARIEAHMAAMLSSQAKAA